MLTILADGENRHRLETKGGSPIGWIRGRAIGFTGFPTIFTAQHAALAGARALQAALRQHYPGWPPYEPVTERLRLTHDGAYEWVTDGTAPIARLLRPGADSAPRFGLEYVLPSFASEGVAITVAQSVARALEPHWDELPGATLTVAHGSHRARTRRAPDATPREWGPDDAA